MKPSPEFTRHMVEATAAALEQDERLRGKRTLQIEHLAGFRRDYRRRFYWLAEYFYAAALFQTIVAAYATGPAHWAAVAGFCMSFPGIFFCEFRARLMTRQLNRPASEQMARDLIGVGG